jgi:hypothetical protein
MEISPETYMNEPVRYPALHVVDLAGEGSSITESYHNWLSTA